MQILSVFLITFLKITQYFHLLFNVYSAFVFDYCFHCKQRFTFNCNWFWGFFCRVRHDFSCSLFIRSNIVQRGYGRRIWSSVPPLCIAMKRLWRWRGRTEVRARTTSTLWRPSPTVKKREKWRNNGKRRIEEQEGKMLCLIVYDVKIILQRISLLMRKENNYKEEFS